MTLERALIERYHWSLADIDRTDIESLLAFVMHKPPAGRKAGSVNAFCDQVNFL